MTRSSSPNSQEAFLKTWLTFRAIGSALSPTSARALSAPWSVRSASRTVCGRASSTTRQYRVAPSCRELASKLDDRPGVSLSNVDHLALRLLARCDFQLMYQDGASCACLSSRADRGNIRMRRCCSSVGLSLLHRRQRHQCPHPCHGAHRLRDKRRPDRRRPHEHRRREFRLDTLRHLSKHTR
jgi:hypothetical protein